MPDRLVTLAVFDYPHEAHLLRTKLEAENITCFLAHENTAQLLWPEVGRVKVQIRESDMPRATAILRGKADFHSENQSNEEE